MERRTRVGAVQCGSEVIGCVHCCGVSLWFPQHMNAVFGKYSGAVFGTTHQVGGAAAQAGFRREVVQKA